MPPNPGKFVVHGRAESERRAARQIAWSTGTSVRRGDGRLVARNEGVSAAYGGSAASPPCRGDSRTDR
jgi:hypothetical protein